SPSAQASLTLSLSLQNSSSIMAEGTMPMTLPKLLAGAQLSHLQSQETLGTAELREAVRCPASVDEDTWIAAQMKEIFVEAVRMVHFMGEFCHESRCPKMCAGDSTEYKWAEEGTAAAPESMPAISYMQRLIDWADRKLLDQALVPCEGSPMPASLRPELATMLRRLFRIYAHAYVHHFAQIQAVGAEAHVNCSFKHFLFFVLEFKLVRMEEMLPLEGLIRKFAGDLL
ncbi:MOB kinase activator-like 1A (Mob1 homolog 1A) (Mps one binder kinase activator-like 1A) (MsMob1-1) (MsMob1-2) (MsMob1-3) (MsMob1-A), partial [Durusdinium trenchii]